jgi:CelD/BcsL family acetyltransferase involved in cellulose biosynthesis
MGGVPQIVQEEHGEVIEVPAAALDGLAEEWSRCVSRGECAEPFLQPYWFSAFAHTFGESAPVVLGIARRGSELLGVLPLRRRSSFFCGVPAKTLQSLSGAHSCRYDLCSADGEKEVATHEIWRALRADSSWDVIEALNVPEHGGFESLMRWAAKDGFFVARWRTLLTPYLSISPGDPFRNCPPQQAGNRNRLKSYFKKLEKRGVVQIASTAEYTDGAFEAFVALEAAGWKGRDGGAIGCKPVVSEFYQRALKGAARAGHLRVQSLLVDGKPVAMELGLLMNRRYYSPKFAYDESFSKCSPGNLMNRESIQLAADSGVELYDFLGPRARHKLLWTDKVRPHSNCYIFRPNIAGRLRCHLIARIAPQLRRARHYLYGDPQAV